MRVRQEARRMEAPTPMRAVAGRRCAMCGAEESEGADIRVCSCATCKGLTGTRRELCLEHARKH